jgi:formate hydrogenlyase subunit 6/NADH:ubiquinone oxidoreductase subunit I
MVLLHEHGRRGSGIAGQYGIREIFMKAQLVFNSEKCTGCRTCSLTCSFSYFKVFNPERAFIEVIENEENGSFELKLKDGCTFCRICEESCPFEVIKRVEESA